jgi:AcrR family transcriptional regulator
MRSFYTIVLNNHLWHFVSTPEDEPMNPFVAANERARETVDSRTASRILDSAFELFAARGFDAVSVRDIAEAAGANPAAISYYFGAKEQLIQHAIRSVVAPLNALRLSALGEVLANESGVAIEDVVRAMIGPTVRACFNATGPERHYARIWMLSLSLRQPYIDEVMNEQTDGLLESFIGAMRKALPDRDSASLYWGYDFMIGAMLHILLDRSRNYRLRRVSEGQCDTSDPDVVIAELVNFVVSGLKPARPLP